MTNASLPSTRSSSTSSPTASLSPLCLMRPRTAQSYVRPSAASTRQIPPVPDNAVPRISVRARGSFVPHGIPPSPCRTGGRLLDNELVQNVPYRLERHLTDRGPRRCFGRAV